MNVIDIINSIDIAVIGALYLYVEKLKKGANDKAHADITTNVNRVETSLSEFCDQYREDRKEDREDMKEVKSQLTDIREMVAGLKGKFVNSA